MEKSSRGSLASTIQVCSPVFSHNLPWALSSSILPNNSSKISEKVTKPITYATMMEVVGIIGAIFIGINFFDAIGVVAAMIAYTFGRLLANGYLFAVIKKSV